MTTDTDKLVEMAVASGAGRIKLADGDLIEFTPENLAAFRAAIIASLCGDVEPVALVGEVYGLYWIGAEPVAEIVRRTGVKPGDKLYPASVVAAITAQRDTLQARIDALMLEHCPDEMTDDQRTNWARHQVATKGQP